MSRALVLILFLAMVSATSRVQTGGVFEYVHSPGDDLVSRVELERRAVQAAADAGEAERWGVTLALLLEIAKNEDDAVRRAAILDAVLEELVHARAWKLIQGLSRDRRRSLHAALAAIDADDPVGMRRYTRQLAQRRLDVIAKGVLAADDPNNALDRFLAAHGWNAPGGKGPLGRQRAKDRADFRVIGRHEVFKYEGMERRHMLLPPTEVLAGVPVEDLEYRWQRARNFSGHMDRLWTHQDGPRVHDFLLDVALRDATGIVRLVHADTQLLAHADRMRRWRLREALWRLAGG